MRTRNVIAFLALASLCLASQTISAQDAKPAQPAPAAETKPGEKAPAPAAQTPAAVAPSQEVSGTNGNKGLRFNFHQVPLEMVLSYLSDACGFIIIEEARVEGRIDAWSNTPLSKEEAVSLLNTVL